MYWEYKGTSLQVFVIVVDGKYHFYKSNEIIGIEVRAGQVVSTHLTILLYILLKSN